MRRLLVGATTDRGRVRQRNEDALIAGESVFAVADGMGGHLAGDVAAATALLPIGGLDGKVFPDSASAQAALLDAILAANAAVVRKASDDPGLRGMGTTLTATIVEGRRLHVGHVGDSRAYLIRGGELVQLTRDHTLVERLVEEGQITQEEAAHHPHRSVITRAIGVDVDLEVDTLTIELEHEDAVMLCSDGLTGPLEGGVIRDTVLSTSDPQEATERLVDLANEHGGPDNITVVIVRFEDRDSGPEGSTAAPSVIRSDALEVDSDWVRQMGRLGALSGNRGSALPREERPSGPGAVQRAIVITLVVAGLIAATLLGGWWVLSRSYYVGVADGQVVIYQGVPASIGPLELSWVAEETDVYLSHVAPWYVRDLEAGVPATDIADARLIVTIIPMLEDREDPGLEPDPPG